MEDGRFDQIFREQFWQLLKWQLPNSGQTLAVAITLSETVGLLLRARNKTSSPMEMPAGKHWRVYGE